MCFIRESHLTSESGGSIELIAHNADSNDLSYSDEKVELSMYHYRKNKMISDIILVQVYNHPDKQRTIQNFATEFESFMRRHCDWIGRDLIVFGDFNIDFNLQDIGVQELKSQLKLSYNVEPTIYNTPTRPKSGRQIDWVFSSKTRNLICNSSLYTTWFSDHQPLLTEINFT